MSNSILCSVSTRGRYNTTLPLCLSAIANQTKKPDHLIIFDDNETPIDLRDNEVYKNLFLLFERKNIGWQVVYGQKKGQHYNHQTANQWGFEWVWRVDDDCIPDPNVLENLYAHVDNNVGCVGGSVITPSWDLNENDKHKTSGKIEDIYWSQNKQWFLIDKVQEVDHLHCTFLYRAGIVDYNLKLSRVAHREETLFSYEFVKRGYKNLIVPNAISYHLKSAEGGIRDGDKELYYHDEEIFRNNIDCGFLVTLDCGIGDNIVFESLINEMKNKYKKFSIATWYPDVFEEVNDENISIITIEEAKRLIDTESQNIYRKMIDWNWKGSLQDAFKKLYKL